MSWFYIISPNFKTCVTELSKFFDNYIIMNCHQISVTRVNFSLVIYNYFILMFCKNVPAKCFIIEQIHEKEPDKCPNIQVSDTFKIITLNWGKISEILMEN